jgi:hypothetical protein
MAHDPDFIDPAVLRRRAAKSGGAGAKPGRPVVKRVPEKSQVVRISDSKPVFQGLKVIQPVVKIDKNQQVRISR